MFPGGRVDNAHSLAYILQSPHNVLREELYYWLLQQEPAVWSGLRIQIDKVVGVVLT